MCVLTIFYIKKKSIFCYIRMVNCLDYVAFLLFTLSTLMNTLHKSLSSTFKLSLEGKKLCKMF